MSFRSFFLKGNHIAKLGPPINRADKAVLPTIAQDLLRTTAGFDGIEIWDGAHLLTLVRAPHWEPSAG